VINILNKPVYNFIPVNANNAFFVEPFGPFDREFVPKLIPDKISVFDPIFEVIEIGNLYRFDQILFGKSLTNPIKERSKPRFIKYGNLFAFTSEFDTGFFESGI